MIREPGNYGGEKVTVMVGADRGLLLWGAIKSLSALLD